MNYTVVWVEPAESEYIEIWLESSNRAELTRIGDEIDAALSRDPYNVGESRNAGRYIALCPPLAVEFSVDEDDRMVRVFHIREYPHH